MEMDDNKLKRLLQEGMEWDADRIMEEVNSDPSLKDAVAPEEIHDKLMQQIREHEDAKEQERERLSQEEQELIRLGKILKKRRGRNKYIVLIAAVVCALAVGTISFGDGKKVFTEIQRMLGDRKQSVVNTDDGDGAVVDEIASEEEAYAKIEEVFGFYPVEMYYLPEGMEFSEVVIDEEMQGVRLYYGDTAEKRITYYIITDYRTGSMNMDIEDKLVYEYEKEVKNRKINIREYLVEDNGTSRYLVGFNEQEIQYWILLIGADNNEVEKIVENLYFS